MIPEAQRDSWRQRTQQKNIRSSCTGLHGVYSATLEGVRSDHMVSGSGITAYEVSDTIDEAVPGVHFPLDAINVDASTIVNEI